MQPNSKRIEERFECKLPKGLLLTIYEYLEDKSLNEKKTGTYLNKDEETKLLIAYCKEKSLLFNPLPFSTYLDEGAEQKVYLTHLESCEFWIISFVLNRGAKRRYSRSYNEASERRERAKGIYKNSDFYVS